MTAQTLRQGEYTLLADCPECGFTVHFPLQLASQLTVDDTGSKLRPVLRAKSRDHQCGTDSAQQPLPFLTRPAP